MRGNRLKIILPLIIALAFTGFYYWDLQRYLNLSFLKSQQADLAAAIAEHRVVALAGFFLVYVLFTGLSLPGATILTLAAGAFFGLGTGLIVVSFASSLGATLAFLAARFVLREAVLTRWGERLTAINEGFRRDGAFYLFSLRLVPLFPFFAVNLLMGLTPMRARSFYWVSQLGMLAGTFVYVNAGTQLTRLDSLSGILSPQLIASFVLLGLLPLLGRKTVDAIKGRRALGAWKKPRSFDHNVIVIGAGSGGLVSAYIAAAIKAKVALIEKAAMGGDCLNTGCVPSKALISSAKALSLQKRAADLGFRSVSIEFDFATLMERIQKVVEEIAPHDSIERYRSLGVDCIRGEARILSPYEVSVNGQRLTTRTIIVATGAQPIVPSIPGVESIPYLTSDTIWNLRVQPQRLLILGAGPIGCELAQAFARLGTEVMLLDSAPRILQREDRDVSRFIGDTLSREGVKIWTGSEARSFCQDGKAIHLSFFKEGKSETLVCDAVLFALGRKARTKGFGLEELGVRLAANGTIEHDDFLATNIPTIYCVGDVAGPFQFTHAAAHQAWYASVNALFAPFKRFRTDYRHVPRVTFTDPEIAAVGLNEQEAEKQGIAYELTTYQLDDLDRAITEGAQRGFVKVLTVPGKDRILGAILVGAHAGEYLVEFVTAMKYGIGLNKILGTIHAYPSFSEANKYAAGAWKRAHAPVRILAYLEAFHRLRRGRSR